MNENDLLTIKPIENNDKDKQIDHPYADAGIIPRMGTASLFVGATRSGKSTLIQNLFQNFYKDFFDVVYILSPTSDTDDVCKSIMKITNQPKQNCFTDLEEGIEKIGEIMKIQKALIAALGIDNVPKICIMFDDFISSKILLKKRCKIRKYLPNKISN